MNHTPADDSAPAPASHIAPLIALVLLTFGSLLVHGYHPWAEDAEIYLPGAEKLLNPELFPFGAQFFESHARLTLFPNLVAALVRASHLSLGAVLFFLHLSSIFVLLLACWKLSGQCFPDTRARWAGVGMVAALLTLPVAGTALYIMDQYVNPRNLAAGAVIFAIERVVAKRYIEAGVFLAVAAAMHPFMSVFALFYSVCLVLMQAHGRRQPLFAMLLPLGALFQPASPAYHEVALSHPFHYLLRWAWYEWLGIFAPLVILWWFSRLARLRGWKNLDLLCRALIPFELVCFAAAFVLSVPESFESLARIQPLRSLHLLYILFLLFSGGFLAEYVVRNRAWRWIALYAPLCAAMLLAQRALFRSSAHIEWPGSKPRNHWVEAFFWIRDNTPPSAIFALDPYHMAAPGEDANGFRAVAQRSMIADAVKDSGAVTMFPALAGEWLRQVQAQRGWKSFRAGDFSRLRNDYGVGWLVIEQPGIPGLDCPHQNEAVLVCHNGPAQPDVCLSAFR